MPADRRWSVGRTSEMTWRSKRIETETSCRHSRLNARWILESSSLEALGMKTASRKLPKSGPQAAQAFFFFFLPLSLFFFLAKKLTHKQVRPRNVVVLISQSFVCTASWHWPRPARSAFFHNNACSRGRYPTSERPRSLSRQNNLGRYLARTTLRHNV